MNEPCRNTTTNQQHTTQQPKPTQRRASRRSVAALCFPPPMPTHLAHTSRPTRGHGPTLLVDGLVTPHRASSAAPRGRAATDSRRRCPPRQLRPRAPPPAPRCRASRASWARFDLQGGFNTWLHEQTSVAAKAAAFYHHRSRRGFVLGSRLSVSRQENHIINSVSERESLFFLRLRRARSHLISDPSRKHVWYGSLWARVPQPLPPARRAARSARGQGRRSWP